MNLPAKFILASLIIIVPILSGPFINTNPVMNVQAVKNEGTLNAVYITNVEYFDTSFDHIAAIDVGNGEVSPLWKNIPSTLDPSFGSNGKVQAAYGANTAYFLLTYDASIKWVAMQWDNSSTQKKVVPMQKNDDMLVMGHTSQVKIDGDGYSAGQGVTPFIYKDKQNDVKYEIIPGSSVSHVEIARKFLTHDTAGHDIQFYTNRKYTVLYASDPFHGVGSKITQMVFQFSNMTYGQNLKPAQPVPQQVVKLCSQLSVRISSTVVIYSVIMLSTTPILFSFFLSMS